MPFFICNPEKSKRAWKRVAVTPRTALVSRRPSMHVLFLERRAMITLEKIGLDSIQAGNHVFVGSIITLGIEPLVGVVRVARQAAENEVGTGAEDLGIYFS